MKNSFKKFVFIMLAFAFLFVNSVSAFAAEFTTVEAVQSSISTQSNSFPYSSLANSLNTTTSWKTIATSNTGFSCNVFIKCMNTTTSGWGVVPSDVRMLGKNGNVVWTENGAVPCQGDRTFWCGYDVYTIQIRTQAGYGVAIAHQA